jgi:phage recombination protein Bet
MTEALAPIVTSDQLELIKKTVANGATDAELKLYLFDCSRQGVHPLDKLLHFTKRGGKYTPVTSIDLMRIRAAETNEYAGSDDAVFSNYKDGAALDTATITVWRLVQGTRCSFTATARWNEYYPGDQQGHMWKKMPHTMLAKCAEALALRKGFPRQLAGLYAAEEMDQANRGETKSVEAEDSQNVFMPEGLDPSDLPDGVVYLKKWAVGMGKAKGFIWHTGQGPTDDGLALYKQVEQARQWCQEGTPVTVKTKKSQTSDHIYVDTIEPFKTARPAASSLLANNEDPF